MPNRPKNAALGAHQSEIFGMLCDRGLLKHDAFALALQTATRDSYDRSTITLYVSGDRRPEFGVLGVLARHVGPRNLAEALLDVYAPGTYDVVDRVNQPPTGASLTEEVLDAVEAVGRVLTAAREARGDGVVTPEESARVRALIEQARQQLAEAEAALGPVAPVRAVRS